MGTHRHFNTSATLSFDEGGEHEFKLRISYIFTTGHKATREQPGEPDSVEVQSVYLLGDEGFAQAPKWLADLAEADTSLALALMIHAVEMDDYESEQAAEARADDDRLFGQSIALPFGGR